jgi:hypothetical protein
VIAGVLCAILASGVPVGSAAVGGLVAGAACALIGLVVSYLLRDVPAAGIVVGTAGSAVAGAIGGALAAAMRGTPSPAKSSRTMATGFRAAK